MPLRFAAPVLLLLLAQACAAQTEIDQLFEQTGMRQEIFQIPDALDELTAPIMRQTCPRCSSATIAATAAAFHEAFEPAALYQDIRQRFALHYNSAYTVLVFHDLEATVYGRINALDIQAETPGVKAQLARLVAGLAAPRPGKRVALLRQYAQVSGASDVMAGLVCQIIRSVAPEPAGCADVTAPMKRAYTEAMVKRWYYLYQDLSDDDLTQAIRIAGTPAERWFMTAFGEATGDAFAVRMQLAMARMTRQIAPAR